MTEARRQSRWMKNARRLAIAMAMAFLLAFLGLFDNLGYNVRYIEEKSWVPHFDLNFGEAVVYCDMIFNPVLFPLYWLAGSGHISGNFSMIYVAEAYGPGEYGGPRFGAKPQDRFDFYVMKLVIWGLAANLILLLHLTIIIEAVGKRSLYLVVFFCTAGFAFADIIGALIGIFVGAFAVYYILFKMSPENFMWRFWESLWE